MAVSTVYDLTAANAALKELYIGQEVENLVYDDNPTLAMIPKMTEFGGKYMPIPIISVIGQGRSATYANALANQTATTPVAFQLTRNHDYSLVTIDNETMLAATNDRDAFLLDAKAAMDGGWRIITLSSANALFRSGTGSIAQISTISTGVITLGTSTVVDPQSVVHFEVNMKLNAAATDGATPRAATGFVIAVDRTAGTVTVSTTLGGSAGSPAAWAANDFLLVDGDSNAKMKGFAAWLPTTAPSATLFFNVDRSVDTVRLGGVRYDASAQSIEEGIIDGVMLLAREGGKGDHLITNYNTFGSLEKSMGSKVQYIDYKGPGEIMFRGILVNGPRGPVKVFPDRSCQSLRGYMLTMNTWKLYSLGDVPMILRYTDENDMLRVYNADQAEARIGYYANPGCKAPGWNEVITFGA